MKARLLTQADYPLYEAYLRDHADTSMFLRSNALKAGLDFRSQPFQAYYFGVFTDEAILTGVLALNWNGNIFSQADDAIVLSQLIDRAVDIQPDFMVKGVLAPFWQAEQILSRFNLPTEAYQLSENEDVYRLQLADLVVPEAIAEGAMRCRLITLDDVDVLTEWGMAYEIEALGIDPATPDLKQSQRDEVLSHLAQNDRYILCDAEGRPIAKAALNAQLPDIVQIGGVYTPPAARGLGYAQAVVAGMLLIARSRGVTHSVLFTKNPAAASAYKKIGYVKTGNYNLTLLKHGVKLG